MIVLRVEFRGRIDAQPQFVVEAPAKGETPETESLAQWVNALDHKEGVRRLRNAILKKCRELAPEIRDTKTEPPEAEPLLARENLARLLQDALGAARADPVLRPAPEDDNAVRELIQALRK
jgi:hypothetical protein